MKFTLSWLESFLDTSAPIDQIAETLTAIGLEVEGVIDMAADLKPFTVAQIEEAVQHPNADKLRVCKVNDGTGIRQVVCGAPNARAGIKVVLAHEGVKIPANGMVIKKSAIRGVESNGMLCSGAELGLDTDAAGIIELPSNAVIGESIVKVMGLDDPVIDVAVTPNRADALGVIGIARDLAAAGLGKLKHEPKAPKLAGHSAVTVSLETPACPFFIGSTITGVKNGPSPDWMQRRLKAVGLRPISALVDITNYMTIAYGRPLHVYDAKKLKGNIAVRAAIGGEKLRALDGKEYTLGPDQVAICDDSGVIGLGGIIGGASTGCDEATTDVFLEGAYFDATVTATTGRSLSVESDARYRFERGVDPAFVKPGVQIALAMIHELCGGTASELTLAGTEPKWKRCIAFDPKKVEQLGGIKLPAEKIVRILTTLGFEVEEGEERIVRIISGMDASCKADGVTPPSWRADIEGEADLVEEVLRIARYDAIPSEALPHVEKLPALPASVSRAATIRRTLAAHGMTEICSWAFVPHAQATGFGGGAQALRLLNPINAELDTMRPSLLPGLLTAAVNNAARGFADLSLFEIGNVFEDATPKGQKLMAAGLHTGAAIPRNPFGPTRASDSFDAKASLFAVLSAAGLNPAKLAIDAQVPAWYHPTRSGRISLGGKITLGTFGEIHPLILEMFHVKHSTAAFEAHLDAIPLPKAKGTARPPLAVSNFQAVERDFAFVADERLPAADIVKAVEGAEKQLIQKVDVFDIYAGKGMEPGKKSVALSVTLQATDRTLTDAEIEAVSQKIINAVKALGLVLRT